MREFFFYHFTFPGELHGERFFHDPGTASELGNNPTRKEEEEEDVSLK